MDILRKHEFAIGKDARKKTVMGLKTFRDSKCGLLVSFLMPLKMNLMFV